MTTKGRKVGVALSSRIRAQLMIRWAQMQSSVEFDDYYELLGVAPDADFESIRHALRNFYKEWHPDVNHSAEANRMTVRANEAKEWLLSAVKRAEYDDYRRKFKEDAKRQKQARGEERGGHARSTQEHSDANRGYREAWEKAAAETRGRAEASAYTPLDDLLSVLDVLVGGLAAAGLIVGSVVIDAVSKLIDPRPTYVWTEEDSREERQLEAYLRKKRIKWGRVHNPHLARLSDDDLHDLLTTSGNWRNVSESLSTKEAKLLKEFDLEQDWLWEEQREVRLEKQRAARAAKRERTNRLESYRAAHPDRYHLSDTELEAALVKEEADLVMKLEQEQKLRDDEIARVKNRRDAVTRLVDQEAWQTVSVTIGIMLLRLVGCCIIIWAIVRFLPRLFGF